MESKGASINNSKEDSNYACPGCGSELLDVDGDGNLSCPRSPDGCPFEGQEAAEARFFSWGKGLDVNHTCSRGHVGELYCTWTPPGWRLRCTKWISETSRSGRPCGWKGFLAIGPKYRGFLARPEESNRTFETKTSVLNATQQFGEATAGQIVEATGLSNGQVRGCLTRCVKYDFAKRSEVRVSLVPQGSGFTFSLTTRGEAFLQWKSNR